MKIIISVFLGCLLFSFSCNEVSLKETGEDGTNIISVKVDPPAVEPGGEINITTAIDNGKGSIEKVNLQVGSNVFTQSNSATLKIPADISGLLGDESAKLLRSNGYVDVPVNIISGINTAKKYFRIKGNSYEPSLYDENPSINALSYSTSQINSTEINPEETLLFNPDDIPEKICFSVDDVSINENIKDNFEYSWTVFGTGNEIPQLVEMNKVDGSATFSFRDSGGAPLVGSYRFYLVVKPSETYFLSYEARYCNDFITFTVNTTGDTDTEEVSDTIEADDTDSEVSDD